MDAIKKKMQAMKLEKDNAMDRDGSAHTTELKCPLVSAKFINQFSSRLRPNPSIDCQVVFTKSNNRLSSHSYKINQSIAGSFL